MAWPAIPAIPRLEQFKQLFAPLSAIVETLEIGIGYRGSPRDKWVTQGQLADLGITSDPSSASSPSSTLGNAAYLDVGTTAGTVAAGDHSHSGLYEVAGAAAEAVAAHESTYGHLTPAQRTDLVDGGISDLHFHSIPDVISVGQVVTISTNRQMVLHGPMSVDGTLTVNGKLVVI